MSRFVPKRSNLPLGDALALWAQACRLDEAEAWVRLLDDEGEGAFLDQKFGYAMGFESRRRGGVDVLDFQRHGADLTIRHALLRREINPFASRSLFSDLREALDWLLRHWLVGAYLDRAQQEVTDRIGPLPDEPVGLAAWAAAAGVAFWLDRRALAVLPDGRPIGMEAWDWFEDLGELTLAQALARRPHEGRADWRPGMATIPRSVREPLRDALFQRAVLRALMASAPPQPLDARVKEPDRFPRLQRLLDEVNALLAEHEEVLGRSGPLLPSMTGRLILQEDPPVARWYPGARHLVFPEDSGYWGHRDAVTLAIGSHPLWARARLGGWRDEPLGTPHQLALLDLAAFLTKAPGPKHERLEVELGRTPMTRLLEDIRIPEPLEVTFELRQSSHGRLWLAICEVTKTVKGRAKLRTIKPHQLDPDRLADPVAQRAVYALLGDSLGSSATVGEYKQLQENPGRIARALDIARGLPHLSVKTVSPRPLDVRRAELELRIDADADLELHLAFRGGRALDRGELRTVAAAVDLSAPVFFLDAKAAAVTLVDVTARLRRVARALAERGSRFASTEGDRLLEGLPDLVAAVPTELPSGLAGRKVAAASAPTVRLELVDQGLRMALFTRPLTDGAVQLPGVGATTIYGVQGEERVHTRRDLRAERARATELVARLGLDAPDDDLGWSWTVQDPASAGEVLAGLRAAGVPVEWRGRTGRLRAKNLGLGALSLRLRSLADWFQVEGEARLGQAELPLAELLAAAESGRRFLSVKAGDWVELDEALVGALQQVAAAAATSDDGISVSALHAPLFAELEEELADLDAPPDWLSAGERLREAAQLEVPVPDTLQAELRPYQEAGFAWLARLAHWGPGAVLADDMGLGKTVQALALLLRRAGDGPSLVVAPASVGFNWAREAARFAPSLQVVEYAGPEREARLDGLGPGSLLVTSWALLVRDAERLGEVRWGTVVFDEAQAMKNRRTGRNKAARGLDAGFRLALTGTPLENHVGELHAILSALAPGLLGSERRFGQRFARPIAGGDEQASAALSRVVAPFVLRRLKSQVATELPPRTEVEVGIELSLAERELYDRVRRAALAQLELASETGDAQRRFQALGMLTRLRQAACHPRLVEDDSSIPSSKLTRLLRLLGDLREEGHRALVFSQFVGHLQLVRAALEERGFRLLYLDGSTPSGQRGGLVDRFQAGEADVFLISLKAGGTGLNLTAASYVVHLDPWWNPAAEDQATDRAHRIGQDQPVTVYRLVARGTVEESIVRLHARKREVAEQVLAGAGSTRSLNPDELMQLVLGEGEFALEAPTLSLVDGGGGEDEDDGAVEESGAEQRPPPALRVVNGGRGESLRALVERWRASLDAEVAAGTLSEPSAQSYARVAVDLVEWVEAHGAGAGLDAAVQGWPAIQRAIQDGSWTGGKTIRYQGKLVLNRLRRFGEG